MSGGLMGDVVDIHRKHAEQLSVELACRLKRENGSVREQISELSVEVETWRKAARRAGRVAHLRPKEKVHLRFGYGAGSRMRIRPAVPCEG
jgi:hypothetical protein